MSALFFILVLLVFWFWDTFERLLFRQPNLHQPASNPNLGAIELRELAHAVAKTVPESRRGSTASPTVHVHGAPITVAPPNVEVHTTVGSEPLKVEILQQAQALGVKAEPIFFEPGEPERFGDYEGQEHVIESLELQIGGLGGSRPLIRPQLFVGPAGLGKTLIAKIVANEHQHRGLLKGLWIEVFPESFEQLDPIMRLAGAHPGSTLFFDEVHMLGKSDAIRLYEFLNNNRYQFKRDTQATPFPPTLLLAATTDPGQLEAAFKRRFHIHHLRPMRPEELARVLLKRTSQPADTKALELLVERTHHSGAPWEALALLQLAESSARVRNAPVTEVADVERIFRIEQLDHLGLRWLDRQVIRALLSQPKYRQRRDGGQDFVCYAASEQNVCMLAQLDRDSYREQVRPRLMSRGLLMLRPYYGQSLTDKAVAHYGGAS